YLSGIRISSGECIAHELSPARINFADAGLHSRRKRERSERLSPRRNRALPLLLLRRLYVRGKIVQPFPVRNLSHRPIGIEKVEQCSLNQLRSSGRMQPTAQAVGMKLGETQAPEERKIGCDTDSVGCKVRSS